MTCKGNAEKIPLGNGKMRLFDAMELPSECCFCVLL